MRRSNHEAGYMLVGVLLAITVLAIVGTSLVTLSVNSVKTSSSERDNQAVYYIAEAGLTYLESEFEKAVAEIYDSDEIKTEEDFFKQLNKLDFVPERYDTFEKVQDSQPFAELEVEKITEEKGSYKLISTGNLDGENRRVSQIIQVGWNDKYEEVASEEYKLPPFAVFTSGQFTMSNGTISGDIGTISEKVNAINFPSGGPTLIGDIYVPYGHRDFVNQSSNKGNSEIKKLNEGFKMPQLPIFPDIPNYNCPDDVTISTSPSNKYDVIKNCNLRVDNWIVRDSNYKLDMNENMKFNEIKFDSNFKLEIDVKDENRIIVVNHLNMQNGHMELGGSGNLTIFVIDKITFGSGSTINDLGDISRLNLYYKGLNRVELAGSQKIYGSLYAESADIKLARGGGFFGNIFTGGENFIIEGGSYNQAQLFFAPYARFDMTSGGEYFEGMIIADRFEINGGWKLNFKELNFSNGPISPAALGSSNENGGSGGTNGPGASEIIETGASPSFTKGKVREESK